MSAHRPLFPMDATSVLTIDIDPVESFRALLHRIAETHGLRAVTPVLDTCRRRGPRPMSLRCLPAVAQLCGASVEELALIGGRDADYVAGKSTWHFGAEAVTHYPSVDTRLLPVCPHCLREHRRVPAVVHLAPKTACELDKCRLLFDCVRCGTRLRSDRRRLLQCDCGFDLRESSTEPAEPAELLFARALSALAGSVATGPVIVRSEVGVLNLSAMSLNELVYVHWALGHALQLPQESCLGSRRRLSPQERIQASLLCVQTLRNPAEIARLCSAWLRAREPDQVRVAWFVQNVLSQALRVRGMGSFACLVPAGFMKRPSRQRAPRPDALIPARVAQMELPFERGGQ